MKQASARQAPQPPPPRRVYRQQEEPQIRIVHRYRTRELDPRDRHEGKKPARHYERYVDSDSQTSSTTTDPSSEYIVIEKKRQGDSSRSMFGSRRKPRRKKSFIEDRWSGRSHGWENQPPPPHIFEDEYDPPYSTQTNMYSFAPRRPPPGLVRYAPDIRSNPHYNLYDPQPSALHDAHAYPVPVPVSSLNPPVAAAQGQDQVDPDIQKFQELADRILAEKAAASQRELAEEAKKEADGEESRARQTELRTKAHVETMKKLEAAKQEAVEEKRRRIEREKLDMEERRLREEEAQQRIWMEKERLQMEGALEGMRTYLEHRQVEAEGRMELEMSRLEARRRAEMRELRARIREMQEPEAERAEKNEKRPKGAPSVLDSPPGTWIPVPRGRPSTQPFPPRPPDGVPWSGPPQHPPRPPPGMQQGVPGGPPPPPVHPFPQPNSSQPVPPIMPIPQPFPYTGIPSFNGGRRPPPRDPSSDDCSSCSSYSSSSSTSTDEERRARRIIRKFRGAIYNGVYDALSDARPLFQGSIPMGVMTTPSIVLQEQQRPYRRRRRQYYSTSSMASYTSLSSSSDTESSDYRSTIRTRRRRDRRDRRGRRMHEEIIEIPRTSLLRRSHVHTHHSRTTNDDHQTNEEVSQTQDTTRPPGEQTAVSKDGRREDRQGRRSNGHVIRARGRATDRTSDGVLVLAEREDPDLVAGAFVDSEAREQQEDETARQVRPPQAPPAPNNSAQLMHLSDDALGHMMIIIIVAMALAQTPVMQEYAAMSMPLMPPGFAAVMFALAARFRRRRHQPYVRREESESEEI